MAFLIPAGVVYAGHDLEDLIQQTVVGITGLSGDKIRPRWQPVPPQQPDINDDWAAFGVGSTDPDAGPFIDALDHLISEYQRHETLDVQISFYGPNSQRNAAVLRDGLAMPFNMALFKQHAATFVEVSDIRAAPDLVNTQWMLRHDLTITLRRQIVRRFAIPTLAFPPPILLPGTGTHTVDLSLDNVINVTTNTSALAAQTRNFGSLLILGSTPVIDVAERLRMYAGIDEVAADFGIGDAEYNAAVLYFSQKPKLTKLYIGRIAQTATSGLWRGKILTGDQQKIAAFNAVTAGSMGLTIDGTAHTVTGLDLSQAANLNAVAAAVTAQLGNAATVTWSAGQARFMVTSASTDTASTVSNITAGSTGTDLSTLLGLAGGLAVAGSGPETILEAVEACADMSTDWYGLAIVAPIPSDADVIKVAQFIEAATPARIFGVTTQDTAALDRTNNTDLTSRLAALNLGRTLTQYSSSSPYAVVSLLARTFGVNFNGQNTTITLKFKQEPSIAAEHITFTQSQALKSKNCNVFAAYNNNTAIIQEGTMANGVFIDERHGLDWLQNDIQTAIWNFHYSLVTKVPQTDQGIARYVGIIESRLNQAVNNGLVAPGIWNGDAVGALETGQMLAKGFYVYANSVNDQSQADREGRKAPPIQAAIKLAGAVHFVDILLNVNR